MKRFASNQNRVLVISGIVVTLILLGYLENGYSQWFSGSLLLGAIIVLFVGWLDSRTYLLVKENRTLTIGGERDLGAKYQVDIYDIDFVQRIPQWKITFLSGAYIVLYLKDMDGKYKKALIRETNFDGTVIKSFLEELKKINSSIKFNSQYIDLMEGKLEPSDLKSTKATETIEEVEKRLGIQK